MSLTTVYHNATATLTRHAEDNYGNELSGYPQSIDVPVYYKHIHQVVRTLEGEELRAQGHIEFSDSQLPSGWVLEDFDITVNSKTYRGQMLDVRDGGGDLTKVRIYLV